MPVPTRSRREAADAKEVTAPRPGGPSGWLLGLFEESPFGLAITDHEGCILTANRRAIELLFPGGSGSDGPGSMCCQLICEPLNRQNAAASHAACLTRRAVATGRALPEARLEIDMGGVRNSVWVSASPIDCGEARAVVYLRPEDLSCGDQRRRAVPRAELQAPPLPELRIHTFGQTRVEITGTDLGGDWLSQRPGQLLEFLLCERHRVVASEQISEALWPGAPPWSTNSVRHQVHALRERLEPGRHSDTPSQFIVTRRGGYMLHPERVWIDADEFEDSVRAGLTLFVHGEGDAATAPLERGLGLYQGDFFSEDPYSEWALEERDRLRELAGRALRAIVSLKKSAGDLDGAAGHARRLAAMEAFDMDVQRDFLEICIRRGRRSEAMRRYALLRRRVRQEFGHEPDFTLGDLGT